MTCFVDTSALLAVLNRSDEHHTEAGLTWRDLMERREVLWTTSGVLLETVAILQHRAGVDAVRVFHTDVCPVLQIEWSDANLYQKAVGGVLAARRRDLSLVDCLSFEVMRQRAIRRVFAFDSHFSEQGFEVLCTRP